MKKHLFILILATTITSFAQQKATVNKVNGIEVYLLAEPVRTYEIVDIKNKGIQWGSFITGGLINASISTKVTRYINRLIKEYEHKTIPFDAILYSNGKQMSAIKFTDEATTETKGIAVVQKIKGIPFFVMNEPLQDYTLYKSIGGGIKWKSAITVGILNNSIEQDLMKFAKKIDNKVKKGLVDAVIYQRSKSAEAIKFR